MKALRFSSERVLFRVEGFRVLGLVGYELTARC